MRKTLLELVQDILASKDRQEGPCGPKNTRLEPSLKPRESLTGVLWAAGAFLTVFGLIEVMKRY